MPSDLTATLATLRRHAQALKTRARVPFSKAPSAAVVLLDDGHWIPGVRIDIAAYSLSLSALANAVTTAVALGRADAIVALVLTHPARSADVQYLSDLPAGAFRAAHDDVFVRQDELDAPRSLPAPQEVLDPFVHSDGTLPEDRIAQARQIARRAHVPASDFPVGALLETADNRLIPGVNVEHEDWARILCAERNALGTALSYGLTDLRALYLSCPLDPRGTPCGACRQWFVELVPEITLWMDRNAKPPEENTPRALLPGSFSGQAIPRSTL